VSAVLSIDAGQSGIRLRLGEEQLPELPGVRTDLQVLPQLADAARQAAGAGLTHVAIGSTGLRNSDTAASLLEMVTDLGIKQVAVAHDSITSYLGALGSSRGAIVASGTGVVALAVGKTSVARVDGWGNILSDAGSGYWIGRSGLEAVMRAHDGRGPATALTEVVKEEFPDLESAYIDIQNDPARVRRVASYSKTVAGLGPSDEVCASIIKEAANQLAHSTMTALRRVGEDQADKTLVSVQGKVFQDQPLRQRFNQLILEAAPGAKIVSPQGDGLDGVGWLFKLPENSPLRAHVSYAG